MLFCWLLGPAPSGVVRMAERDWLTCASPAGAATSSAQACTHLTADTAVHRVEIGALLQAASPLGLADVLDQAVAFAADEGLQNTPISALL